MASALSNLQAVQSHAIRHTRRRAQTQCSLSRNTEALFSILNVEPSEFLVHSEVNANELGFRGLSPKILFYKHVKWLKTLYDKIKPLIESRDSKIYFCNKCLLCRLNMYLKVLLYYLRSNSLF